jgi:hypothetical protein
MTTADSDIIEGLLQNPERNFAQLLFESPPTTAIEILSNLILHPAGYNVTIQCLYVWQDLQNNHYTLAAILEEMQSARDPETACVCMTLVNRLLQYAPDTLMRVRIRRELDGKHQSLIQNVLQTFISLFL